MYLIEYPDKMLLLDSGCRSDVNNIIKYITSIGRKVSDLKLVVVTHAHPDHSGGAMLFRSRYNITIAAPRSINEWYAGFSGVLTYVVDLLLTYFVAKKKKRGLKWIFFSRQIKIDRVLEDLALLPGFADWQVISTPGHTISDISLYNSKASTIYIADNIVASKSAFFRPYPITTPESYQESLKKYIELDPATYLLAHYGENKISKEQIDKLIQGVSAKPRNHRNTLPAILKHLFK